MKNDKPRHKLKSKLLYTSGSQPGVREKSQGVRQFNNNTKIFSETTHERLLGGAHVLFFLLGGTR